MIGLAQAKLDPPTVSTTSSEESVTFRFNAVTNGTFRVQVATDDKMRNVVGSGSTTSTSLTINGLTGGTTYYYEATVTVSINTSKATSGIFKTTDPPLLSPPSTISAAPSNSSVVLAWSIVDGAKSYEYEVYNNDFSKLIGSGQTSATSATVSGLSPATTYKWRIRTINSADKGGDWKSTGVFTTPIARPGDPSHLQATSPTSSGISLSWREGAGATSYDVQILEFPLFNVVQSLNVASTSAVITDLKSNTKYYAKVCSRNIGGISNWIQEEFTTLSPPRPNPPDVSVVPTSNSATFTFKAVSGATKYSVDVFDKQNHTTGSGYTTDASKPVVISNLQNKSDYTYEATVTVGRETSDPTKGSFKTDGGSTAPKPPEVSVATTTNSATFTFKAVTGADSYDVKVFDKQSHSAGTGTTRDASKPVTIDKLQSKTDYTYEATVTVGRETSDPTKGSFKTDEVAVVPRPPEVSVRTTSSTATFTFQEVREATLYKVLIYDEAPHGNKRVVPIDSGSTTDATKPVVISRLKAKTKYYYDATVTVGREESDPFSGSFETTDGAGGVSPPEVTVRTTSSTATFTFKEVRDAKLYQVVLYDEEPKGNKKVVAIDTGSIDDAAKPVVFSRLKSKTMYYYDATVFVGGRESDPTSGSFETSAGSVIAKPEVTVRTTSSTATFTFKEVRDAKLYQVVLYDEEPKGNKRVVPIDTGSTEDATKPVVFSRLKSKTKYYYDATVFVGGRESDPTSDSFETAAGSGIAPPEVSVRTTSSTATFTFKEVKDAKLYQVVIYDEKPRGNKKIVPIDSGSTEDATKPVVISRLKAKTKYYYDATVTVGKVESDPTSDSFDTKDGSGAGNGPEVGVKVTSSTATFTFKEAKDATLYKVLIYDEAPHGKKRVVPVDSGTTTDASKPVMISRLKAKTKYYYDATVTVGRVESDPTSDSFETLDQSSGVKPPEVRLTTTSSTVTFTFVAVAGASSYNVKVFDKQNNGSLVGSGSTTDAARPASISGLQPKTKYYYEATVTVGGLTSEPKQDSFTTDDASSHPKAPEVRYTTTTNSVTFTFTAAGGASSYDIKVSDKQNNGNLVGSGSTNDAARPVTISGLQPKTKYYYDATVVVGGQTSGSAAGSFTTDEEAVTPPAAPRFSSIIATASSVTFTFAPVPGATSYDVSLYDKQSGGSLVKTGATSDASRPVTFSGLQSSTKYFYEATVTSTSGSGEATKGSFTTSNGAGTSGVERLSNDVPATYSLSNNYPNPFNPSTNIEFSLPASSYVRLAIFNALGTEVRSLVDGFYYSGRYLVTWDASAFPSGAYFYRLQTQKSVETKRLMLVK